MFEYKATPLRVIDADTIYVIIDVGFSIQIQQTLRLPGIDCHERFTEAGRNATVFVKDLITGTTGTIKTTKDKEKYGRYLSDYYFNGTSLITELLKHPEFIK